MTAYQDAPTFPEEYPAFSEFYDDGWIHGSPHVIKSGKEATVYRCKATPRSETEFLAIKVYHPREQRNFKNDSMYQQGRVISNARDRRAVKAKSDYGRGVQFGMWIGHEVEMLKHLHAIGANIPRTYASTSEAVLLEYIGDAEGPAPQMRSVKIAPQHAIPVFNCILHNIELFLSQHIVHGDLSPYNILYHNGQVVIIDFPQAIDARQNRSAYDFLSRDIRNVYDYFEPYGIRTDPARLAHALWKRYQRGEL